MVTVLGKLRQEELCEFVSSLVYIVSYRTARTIKRDPVSNKEKKEEGRKEPREGGRKERNLKS